MVPAQLFGTDVSDSSIAKARDGLYPENIQADVSPERLRRFFVKVEGGFRVNKNIRDMCIFAQHNVLSDPPFSQMDLICCRNLLIYLEPVLQKKIIALFHYALRPNGFLVLGSSEGVGTLGNLFALDDRTAKIFTKKAVAARPPVSFSLNKYTEHADRAGTTIRPASKQPDTNWNYIEAQKEFDRRLLSQYAPAAVFVNDNHIRFWNQSARTLYGYSPEEVFGKNSHDLLKTHFPLSSAILEINRELAPPVP